MQKTHRPDRRRAPAAEAGLAHVAPARHCGLDDDDPSAPVGPAPRLALRQAEASPGEDFGRIRAGAVWLLARGGGI